MCVKEKDGGAGRRNQRLCPNGYKFVIETAWRTCTARFKTIRAMLVESSPFKFIASGLYTGDTTTFVKHSYVCNEGPAPC